MKWYIIDQKQLLRYVYNTLVHEYNLRFYKRFKRPLKSFDIRNYSRELGRDTLWEIVDKHYEIFEPYLGQNPIIGDTLDLWSAFEDKWVKDLICDYMEIYNLNPGTVVFF